ncbi:DUF4062 domain-containing protein [Ferribacterium limneticum]|uniref:DUF4062 domain-containing protein n=1 Tax=Ferribacterium limneticum TaxID=76259 RepID=UPI001CFAE6B0|nr:DUF4062 domain-containing protein [Ferribacterium limneticum]UCV18727.1 DUF4062 domain-containing protein [Ferribacterium limneticum]
MGKLRVFISSTMKDLVNERIAIEQLLSSFNIEAVIAEDWLPGQGQIWDRIAKEIRSCDLFVLVVGERYGWIPDSGQKSETGYSVTHLEVIEAKALGLPMLAFFKTLSHETKLSRNDKKGIGALRDLVASWERGGIAGEFGNAFELARKVGESIINVLTDDFQQKRIRQRAELAGNSLLPLAPAGSSALPQLPPRLSHHVKTKKAVLFAGAGISLAAGLPSAAFFAQRLVQAMHAHYPDYQANPVSSAFSGVATDVEGLPEGRSGLLAAVASLVRPPQGVQPTTAHRNAVRVFDQIITTNYDGLFEEADLVSGQPRPIVSTEINDTRLPERVIVNLHGSVSQPESLVLNEREVLLLDRLRPNLWQAVRNLLTDKLVIVVGSSLRDPSIVRLFSEVGPEISGYFIVPEVFETTVIRLRAWNLECIRADAEGFLSALATS